GGGCVAEQAVVVTNINGQVLLWDPGAEQMFGRAGADVIGRPLVETIAAPESLTALTAMTHSLRQGRARSQRTVARNAGCPDARVQVAVNAAPVADVDGTVLSWSWTFVDVTRRARQR